MKIKIQLGILLLIFLLSSYLIYTFVGDSSVKDNNNNIVEKITKDEEKFKKEYEALNDKYDEQRQMNYVNVDIKEDNNIIYSNAEEIIKLLESGTGIIYFGFPECPWCRNAIPVLINTASEYSIKQIYYFNAYDIRDTKHLDESGNIVTDKEGTTEYYRILELLSDKVSVYNGLNDDSIKRLYFPTVVFVKDGKVVNLHVSTVDSQENPSIALTDNQKSELEKIYTEGINDVYDILCDENC